MPVECEACREMSRNTISREVRQNVESDDKIKTKTNSVRILVKRKNSVSQPHDEGLRKVVVYSTRKIYFAQTSVYIL